jgi:hypothetical protein
MDSEGIGDEVGDSVGETVSYSIGVLLSQEHKKTDSVIVINTNAYRKRFFFILTSKILCVDSY